SRPIPGEDIALFGRRSALIEGRPRLGPGGSLPSLPLSHTPATSRNHELTGLPAQRIIIRLCLSGNVHHFPFLGSLSDQPAGEVIAVPACEDENHGRTRCEPREGGIGPPVPGLLPDSR